MAEPRIVEPARFCSQCGGRVVVVDASYCKECGAPLASTVWLNPGMPWRPRTALLLSVVPGLGHWYKGQRVRGIFWFLGVMSFYGLPPVGLMMHIICAGNAALSGALKEDPPARWGHAGGAGTRSGSRAGPTL